MQPEEANRVHVNHCVRDDELAKLDALCAEADPGDWRVVGGEVVRYGGAPFEKREGSLRLMAAAVTAIPRLLRGIRVLEQALRSAWLSASADRRTMIEAAEQHAEDMARGFKGQTGPESDIDALAEAIELGAFSHRPGTIGGPRHRRDWLARTLRAWATGVCLQKHRTYRIDLDRLRAQKAEDDRIRAEADADVARQRAEIRVLLEELRLTKKQREAMAAKVKAKVAGS